MTPAEIKAAYKTSLETLATLTASKDAAEAAYSAACVAHSVELQNNAALKQQLDACIIDGTL
jgi:hypothetical protein